MLPLQQTHRSPNPAMCYSWFIRPEARGADGPHIEIQVCPKDLASALRQAERAVNRPNWPVGGTDSA